MGLLLWHVGPSPWLSSRRVVELSWRTSGCGVLVMREPIQWYATRSHAVPVQMAQLPSNSRLQQDEINTQLTEHGKFSELLQINVPCPVNPDVMLTSVVPSVRHRTCDVVHPIRVVQCACGAACNTYSSRMPCGSHALAYSSALVCQSPGRQLGLRILHTGFEQLVAGRFGGAECMLCSGAVCSSQRVRRFGLCSAQQQLPGPAAAGKRQMREGQLR